MLPGVVVVGSACVLLLHTLPPAVTEHVAHWLHVDKQVNEGEEVPGLNREGSGEQVLRGAATVPGGSVDLH